MFTFGFELNKDEFGMKASNGVTYLFSFRKYPSVDYPMAYLPKQDSIIFFLLREIGNREFEHHVLLALCEEHIHRVLTSFGISDEKTQHEIWLNMFFDPKAGLLSIDNGEMWSLEHWEK